MGYDIKDEEKAFASLSDEVEIEYFSRILEKEMELNTLIQTPISDYLINYKSKSVPFYQYADELLNDSSLSAENKDRLIQYRNMDLLNKNKRNKPSRLNPFQVQDGRKKRNYFNCVGLIIIIILAMLFIMKYLH